MLGHRYCGRLLVGSVSGRLSLGVVPVALVLAAQADGHFLACAGVLAVLYGIAPALGLPLLGRLADLRGLLLPCCLGAALVAVALGTLAVAGTARLSLAVGCAVLAGAGCPPLEGGLRSLWHGVLPDDAHVRTACTLDPGLRHPGVRLRHRPPALAVTVATWLSPAAALALAGAVTVAGSLAFATAPPARVRRAAPRRRGAARCPAPARDAAAGWHPWSSAARRPGPWASPPPPRPGRPRGSRRRSSPTPAAWTSPRPGSPPHPGLQRPAGTSIHRPVGSATCTTRSLLAAGNRLPAEV
ncbi:hypothetical protein ACIQSP_14070 [Streptomyces nigra]|uniref:hypothetical protein n=1 Tax=Streptomyces nigra TaxID=1827580 RepID=UPI00381218FB